PDRLGHSSRSGAFCVRFLVPRGRIGVDPDLSVLLPPVGRGTSVESGRCRAHGRDRPREVERVYSARSVAGVVSRWRT
ncbi:hypothetical protein ACFVXC_39750, partial [Streptomyces sp. NPDC058257]|uniref:hypothetical protein n=1 Tax=Streptomyces sp. NPDC058257 TaxID=3346409 RepID=UPI0036E2AC11